MAEYPVSDGQTSTGLVLNNDSMYVSYGGTATKTTINSGGSMYVYEGGLADNTVNNGGRMYIRGGTADNTTLNDDGRMYISNGGVANSVTVDSKGILWVYDGGTLNSATTNKGYIGISAGGVATDIVENGGRVYIVEEWEGGSANVTFKPNSFFGLVLNDGEWATVHSVTTATDVTVNSDCNLYILGGLASNVTVNDFGNVDVYRGGIVNGCIVNGANSSGGSGGLWVSSGGSVNNVLVNGYLRIESDGIATNIVENGGYVYLSEDWESGQPDVSFLPNSFSGLVLDGTWATVHSGTTATDTTVNSDGIFQIFSGGIASDFTVTSGGSLSIMSRAVLTGKITIEDGATVELPEDADLYFDLTRTSAGAAPLVNDLSYIPNSFLFYLTVDGTEEIEAYSLADCAAAFDSTITVVNTSGTELGTLAVGDESKLLDDNRLYTLTLNGSSLTVTIFAPNGPEEPLNNYLFDAKKAKEDPPNPVLNTNVTEEYGNYLRTTHDEICLDKIGTIDSAGYHNHVGKDDVTDFAKLTLKHGARVSFDLFAMNATKFTVWQLTSSMDKKGKTTYKQKSLQTTVLKKAKDATLYSAQTKNLFLEAGVYYVSMQSTHAKKGGDALYNVTVNGDTSAKNYTIIYADGDSGWNNYLYDKKQDEPLNPNRNSFITTDIYANASEVVLDSGVLHADETGTWKNFAGFGDDTDFGRVYLYDDSRVSFTVNATDAAKFTIWKLVEGTDKKGNTTYTQKNLQTTTLKKDRETGLYTAETKPLLLEYGYYFISIQSTNAKKGGATYYNVEVNQADCEYFAASDNGWNNYLYDKKNKDNPLNFNVYDGSARSIDSETVSVGLDDGSYEDESGTTWSNFVGFGDAADFQKICLNSNATLSFALTATDATKFTIWRLDEKEDKKGIVFSQKSLQATALKKDKETELFMAETKRLSLEAGVYYVSMESTNASKGGHAYYDVKVGSFIAEDAVASALSMPDALSAGYASPVSNPETLRAETAGLLA